MLERDQLHQKRIYDKFFFCSECMPLYFPQLSDHMTVNNCRKYKNINASPELFQVKHDLEHVIEVMSVDVL